MQQHAATLRPMPTDTTMEPRSTAKAASCCQLLLANCHVFCHCQGAFARKMLLLLHQQVLRAAHHRMLPPAMDLTVAGPALVSSGEPR